MSFSFVRITLQVFAVFLVAVITNLGTGSASAQTIALVGDGAQFGYLSLSSLTYTQVASSINTPSSSVQGLAFNQGTLYLLTRQPPAAMLYTINKQTGQVASTIGTLNNGAGFTPADFAGLTFSPTGTLFTYLSGNDSLATVNPANAVFTERGSSGFSETAHFRGKLAFSSSGTLYGVMDTLTNDGLYSFNTSNGSATFIGNGNSSTNAALYGDLIAFTSGTNLYGINGRNLYQVNTTNGNLSLLGAITGSNLPTAFVAGVEVVPEPNSLCLLSVAAFPATFLLPLVKRRRRHSLR